MKLNINNTFISELHADTIKENYPRQVPKAAYSEAVPVVPSNPSLIHFSEEMLASIGLEKTDGTSVDFLNIFSGKTVYPNTRPYAMCYGGHQFGNWAGQLGDGRAINLFEIINNKNRWAVQLKGAGKTPYSRSADGLAVLRSSIREYLCSEAMYHLGVPTTRALSLVLSGDEVLRDVLYNGNPAYEKGAIVARVAPSFIRFGNFEIFAARKDFDNLKLLTDYTIKHFYPQLGKPSKETYLAFLNEVISKTLSLIVAWERVGFVHGVMNTDNMSVLGITIDYGPYGWLEDYDPNWTPNTTDASQKRYRFGNQGKVAIWNLVRLANALYPLINEAEPIEKMLDSEVAEYETKRYKMLQSKLGLSTDKVDKKFIDDLLELLHRSEMDMTLFFRALSGFNANMLVKEFIDKIAEYSYVDDFKPFAESWEKCLTLYQSLLKSENRNDIERVREMNQQNPKYVLRNYMAQLAIDDADKGNYGLIEELFTLLKMPYAEQPENEKWFAKRPDWAKHKVGCSQLSCSS